MCPSQERGGISSWNALFSLTSSSSKLLEKRNERELWDLPSSVASKSLEAFWELTVELGEKSLRRPLLPLPACNVSLLLLPMEG